MPTLDVSQDWQVVDNLESITYYKRLSDTTYDTAVTIDNCLGRAKNVQMQRGGDWVVIKKKTWHLWKANMPSGLIPKAFDKIVDNEGNTWMIDDVGIMTFTTRYQLPTTQVMS